MINVNPYIKEVFMYYSLYHISNIVVAMFFINIFMAGYVYILRVTIQKSNIGWAIKGFAFNLVIMAFLTAFAWVYPPMSIVILILFVLVLISDVVNFAECFMTLRTGKDVRYD